MGFSLASRARAGMSVLYLRGPFRGGGQGLRPSTAVLDTQPQLLHCRTGPWPHPFLAASSSHFPCEHHPKHGGGDLQRRHRPLWVLWSLVCPVGIRSQHLETLRESCKSLVCSHLGRCFLSVELCQACRNDQCLRTVSDHATSGHLLTCDNEQITLCGLFPPQ